jgi:hypothetical protein
MLITVYRNGEEMQANENPDGLALLAKCGWSTQPDKADTKPQKLKAK